MLSKHFMFSLHVIFTVIMKMIAISPVLKLPQFLQHVFESKGFCFGDPLYRSWDKWNINYSWFNLCKKKKSNLQYAILPVEWDWSLSKSVRFFLSFVTPCRCHLTGAELEQVSHCHCVHRINTTSLRCWRSRWSVQNIFNSKYFTFLMHVHSSKQQVPQTIVYCKKCFVSQNPWMRAWPALHLLAP